MQNARARITGAVAVAMALIAGVAYVPSVLAAIAVGQLWIVGLDTALVAWIGALAFMRSRAPRAVAIQLALCLFLTGLVFTGMFGLHSAGPLFLFAVPIFAAVALGTEAAIAGLVLVSAMLLGLGVGLEAEWLSWPIEVPPPIWWMFSGSFVFLDATLAIAVVSLLRRLHTSLARNVRLATALEQTAELVALTDPALRVQWANSAMLTRAGLGLEQARGADVASLTGLGAADRAALVAASRAGAPWRGQGRRQGQGDQTLILDVLTTPLSDPHGDEAGFVVVARDVTRDSVLRAQLERALRLEAIGTLAGGIAHDLSNMLAPVVSNTEVLLAARPDPATTVLLEEISAASHRARALLRRILNVASSTDEPGACDLAWVVQEEMRLVHATVPPNVAVEVSVPPAPIWVRLAEEEVQRVLVNLCVNAAHAIGSGPGAVRVSVQSASSEEMAEAGVPEPSAGAVLHVEDNGCGMDEATRLRVFDPFFTTKEVGAGTGLGLTGVHQLVGRVRGAIAVQSEPGVGTTFRVYLPAAPARAREVVSAASPAMRWAGRRALLIDDDEAVRRAMSRALGRLGIETASEERGADAVARFRADPEAWDVVVTDLTMPGMSGFDVVERVRAIRSDIPVVILTGRMEPELDRRATELGVTAWLLKPITLGELRDVLAPVLGVPHAQRPSVEPPTEGEPTEVAPG